MSEPKKDPSEVVGYVTQDLGNGVSVTRPITRGDPRNIWIGLFVAIPIILIIHLFVSWQSSANKQAAEKAQREALHAQIGMTEKINQKRAVNENRGKAILERAKANARARGWKIDDQHSYCYTTGYDGPAWTHVDQVPNTVFYTIQGTSRAPYEQFMSLKYEESTKKWSLRAGGPDRNLIMRNAYPVQPDSILKTDYWHIIDAPYDDLKTGLLKDLATELANCFQ